ncbi:MAG: serine hydrolase domain-containing protein [Opitutaceae bacterium]|nr:serine hydrolase domain-containing protein [Opitutaceae bacterium]
MAVALLGLLLGLTFWLNQREPRMLASAIAASPEPEVPITGAALPGMARLDRTMMALMTRYDCPGAQLAVTFRGRLVLARGYGLADRETGTRVEPHSLFRIASLSKFITATAVLTLVEQGRLSLDAKAFALLPDLAPLPGTSVDPRLAGITVRQLLQHTAGWNRDVSGDPMFRPAQIAQAAGTPAPADASTIIRYMAGRSLDFDPGTRMAYSNFGYNVLGRLVEAVSGKSYGDYVREAVLAPAGITRARLGRTQLAERAPGEVRYYDYARAALTHSVFPAVTEAIASPDGGFNLEAMDAHGGWVMSAPEYLRLFAVVEGSRVPALLHAASLAQLTERPAAPVSVDAPAYYGLGLSIRPRNGASGTAANWWHGGSLPGTTTYAVRLGSGWSWAAFFNSRPRTFRPFQSEVDSSINAALRGLRPPGGDLFEQSGAKLLTSN